jgi:hypothetical protein
VVRALTFSASQACVAAAFRAACSDAIGSGACARGRFGDASFGSLAHGCAQVPPGMAAGSEDEIIALLSRTAAVVRSAECEATLVCSAESDRAGANSGTIVSSDNVWLFGFVCPSPSLSFCLPSPRFSSNGLLPHDSRLGNVHCCYAQRWRRAKFGFFPKATNRITRSPLNRSSGLKV